MLLKVHLKRARDSRREIGMTASSAVRSATSPTVAVCIGTYNQAQYLRGSIESALAQTYPIQEIWVADDAKHG